MTFFRTLCIVWLALAAHVAPLAHAFAAPCDHTPGAGAHPAASPVAADDSHDAHRHHAHDRDAMAETPTPPDTQAAPSLSDCCAGDGACFGQSCSAGASTLLQGVATAALPTRNLPRSTFGLTRSLPPTTGHYLLPLRPPA